MTNTPVPPPGIVPEEEPGLQTSTGRADQATRPFEEAPALETEQATGMATPDPEKGAP